MSTSLQKPDPGEFFAGQIMDERLYFYGVVKDNAGAAVAGAVVIVCACYPGGTETLLGTTLTDHEGAYLAVIPQIPDEQELLGFNVRAGMACTPLEGVDSPVYREKHPGGEEQLPETEQIYFREPESESATQEITDGAAPEADEVDTETDMETDTPTVTEIDTEADTGAIWGDISDGYAGSREEEAGLTVSLNQYDYNHIPVSVPPAVQTAPATNIGTESATLHGKISAAGGDLCDQIKFQIRIQGSEIWHDAGLQTGAFGLEPFSFTVTGLASGTTYEYKALAHNLAGWNEGDVLTFTATTLPEALAELFDEVAVIVPGKVPRDTLPPKNPYDLYRSNYWRRLLQQK